ncbi:hypothetical protein SCLCIDRAFT_1217021 [Scleroderma citrinum Foug A]|uniref:Uncharacterized protein n=1 Tax=Scleroderma citrinum Foug A TaxID=1036808 RepID=A0A0C3A689_9AGAM|nr:hypothetical protein SCLCIDRAFT_1217021 [Scleroderma citrinum Foug A]
MTYHELIVHPIPNSGVSPKHRNDEFGNINFPRSLTKHSNRREATANIHQPSNRMKVDIMGLSIEKQRSRWPHDGGG